MKRRSLIVQIPVARALSREARRIAAAEIEGQARAAVLQMIEANSLHRRPAVLRYLIVHASASLAELVGPLGAATHLAATQGRYAQAIERRRRLA